MQNTTKEVRRLQRIIGKNIHNKRRKQKLTLKKFSRLTGLSINLLDQYELGKNKMNLRELVMITFVLDTRIESLLRADPAKSGCSPPAG